MVYVYSKTEVGRECCKCDSAREINQKNTECRISLSRWCVISIVLWCLQISQTALKACDLEVQAVPKTIGCYKQTIVNIGNQTSKHRRWRKLRRSCKKSAPASVFLKNLTSQKSSDGWSWKLRKKKDIHRILPQVYQKPAAIRVLRKFCMT